MVVEALNIVDGVEEPTRMPYVLVVVALVPASGPLVMAKVAVSVMTLVPLEYVVNARVGALMRKLLWSASAPLEWVLD